MELETIVYLVIALLLIYYFLVCSSSCSNEHFEVILNTKEQQALKTKECSRSDINNQFYNYNVNVINRLIRS